VVDRSSAPGPIKLFEGARYSIDVAIEIAVGKYLDHLPLERQVRIMGREGLKIDLQTLWDQLERLARPPKETYGRILGHILSKDVIGVDETPWKLLGFKDSNKTWRVWAVGCEDAVCYRIQDSRSLQAAMALLGDYEGTIVCDGYLVYDALAARYQCIVITNCWAHVRRKVLECQNAFPEPVAEFLELVKQLYAIEKLCPTGPPGDSLRLQLRKERSADVVQRIHQWAMSTIVQVLPESTLGKAIEYITGMWTGLTRFLDDPAVPLDNNSLGRALRGPVIGRKNHYGPRSRRGTEVAAVLYTLLESAKLANVDPRAYLRASTIAALNGQPVLLPHEFAAAQSSNAPA
jgi:transposase